MLISSASLAAVFVFLVGLLIFWSNPPRAVNRAVFVGCIQMALWLLCLHLSIVMRGQLFWLRLTCAVGGLAPLNFWLINEGIRGSLDRPVRTWWRGNAGILAVMLVIVALPFTEWFIPSHSTPEMRLRGWAYYGYMGMLVGMYAYLLSSAYRISRTLTGGRRLELQLWLGGGCAVGIAILATMALNAATGDRRYIRIQPLLILLFYAGVAVSITTHRIFDARQVVLLCAEKTLLVGAVAAMAYWIHDLALVLLPGALAWFGTAGFALWFAARLSTWLDQKFHFYPEAKAAREAAFAAARKEVGTEALQKAFVDVLKGWGQCEHALLLAGSREALQGGGIEIAGESATVTEMRRLRWATPERLARERSTPERRELGAFLADQRLGALVFSEGPAVAALLGVGIAPSRRAYTYPQVMQLVEIASITEGALERAHFSVKAQHAEQLATVGLLGASLAHEIRNPLVTIKTFVQLLPKHYQDAAFRDKFFSLIGDEVTRIDHLTEQLLDLATPRVYNAQLLALHPVLRASMNLIAAKAADKRIEFRTDLAACPDQVVTDGAAIRQVLLNLCFNAIQAVENQEARWIKLSTRNVAAGVEMIVEDSGPGIAPGMRPRLFQPFQSTKSSGFGLGLAICSDILADLNSTISVDPTTPGRGATFRVLFPCQV